MLDLGRGEPRDPLHQLLPDQQRQPPACLAVTGGSEAQPAELPKVRDGGVAQEHLQQHESDRGHRREQPVPPVMSVIPTELLDAPGQRTIL